MSFLDYSFAADISPDARVLLFDEEGEAGGANYTVFLRKSDRLPGRPARRGERAGDFAGRQVGAVHAAVSQLALPPAADRDGRRESARGRRREPGAGCGVAARQPRHRVRRQRAGAQPAPVRPVDRRRKAAPDHSGRHRRRHSGVRGLARRPVGRGGRRRSERPPCFRSMAATPKAAHRPSGGGVSVALLSGRTSTCTSGSGATSPRAWSASRSRRAGARSGRTCCRWIRRASSGFRTCSSRRTPRATRTVLRACSRTSSSSKV